MEPGRAPSTLAAVRVAVISRHPRQPARPRGRPRLRSRRPGSTRSGASATSSATAPSPTPARSWSASAARSAWSATTTSRCSARSTSRPSRRPRRRRSTGPGSTSASETLEFLRELEPAGEREGIGLFHASPRDPIWEYVLSGEQADACLDAQAERICADRPLARRPLLHPPRRGTRGDVRGAQASDGAAARPRRAAAGWSTPAASASRATATRGPPGWSSTPRRETARFHRVPYDIERAAASIVAAGLPKPPRRPPLRRPVTRKCRRNLRSEPFSRLAAMARLASTPIARPRPRRRSRRRRSSACGGEDAKLLPGDTAREITANLDTVKQLADEGDCVGAEERGGPGRRTDRSARAASTAKLKEALRRRAPNG